MNKSFLNRVPALVVLACALACACGGTNAGSSTTPTGQSCAVATDCYIGINNTSLHSEALCLDRVPNGYCTHHCTADTDCCAVPGECPAALAEVCAPFESTGEMDCFLSCEADVVTRSGIGDSNTFCQRYANAAFICRSTGGGSANRKVCVPGG